jgi:hypothetical protein
MKTRSAVVLELDVVAEPPPADELALVLGELPVVLLLVGVPLDTPEARTHAAKTPKRIVEEGDRDVDMRGRELQTARALGRSPHVTRGLKGRLRGRRREHVEVAVPFGRRKVNQRFARRKSTMAALRSSGWHSGQKNAS